MFECISFNIFVEKNIIKFVLDYYYDYRRIESANSDEETLVSVIERDDIIEEYYGDTFYSYPYYSVNNFDYQFRATLSGDVIKLEEVKCNEEDLNSGFNKNIKGVSKITFDKGFQMIQNGIDLRTGEKIIIKSETINYT